MARKKDFLKEDPMKDLDAQLNADFNKLVRKVHRSLSTKKRSPVYTGFFASSWKVQTMGVKAKDDIKDFKPWSNIKLASDKGGDTWKPAGFRPSNPKIQPRFKVDKTFNYKRPVFIGNRAKYAAYALESGKVQYFVQGEIGKLIKETMREGKLFIASRKMGDFGSSKGGVGYTEF
tara:strand:+ start:205 stop:729 length:525 start_codon:yes stop_codon:yes gene_type:complete